MMKPRTLGIVAGVVILLAAGFLFNKLPQPIIEIAPEKLFSLGPLNVTNTIFTAWVMIILIGGGLYLGTRKLEMVPRGFQNVFEAVVEGFGNTVTGVAGEKNGRRFFPLVFIFFLYIVLCNWAALTPVFNHIGISEDVFHHLEEEIAHEKANGKTVTSEPHEFQGWVMKKSGITMVPPLVKTKYVKAEVPAGTPLDLQPCYISVAIAAKLERQKPACADTLPKTEGHAAELTPSAGLRALSDEGGHAVPEPLNSDEVFGFVAPFFRGVNTDINAPLSYAIWSAIFVEFWGISMLGLGTYGSKFFAFGAVLKKGPIGIIDIFVGLLELVSEFARLISFTFRLFGNIFAGEVLLFMMSFLVPFVLIDVFYALEIFVGLIQGFVFSMLTLVFAVMATSHHGDHDEHHDDHHDAGHGAPESAGAPSH